jgi:hypothetical protein
MYTNHLIKIFFKPLFDNNFSFLKKFKTSSYFCQMIKENI